MSEEIVKQLVKYLKGGERSGFGNKLPLKKFSGGGEEVGVAKSLAVNVEDVDDCPEGDNAFAATQFGKLVGLAKLSQSDRVMCDVFFDVAYSDETTAYKRGLGHAKREASEDVSAESGLHGGGVPNKSEAEKILEIKGTVCRGKKR